MYEAYREQRPLLSEDISDEEYNILAGSPRQNRRFRHSKNSGRAVSQAKGAINVITSWPGHLSTLVVYWWAGLGMIALTIFIIYNSLSVINTDSFATPLPQSQEIKFSEKSFTNTTKTNVNFLNMFMHIFIKDNEKHVPDKYLPFIKKLANQHSNIKYNFVVVVNDLLASNEEDVSDKHNNEMALNSLWTDNHKMQKKEMIGDILIEHISMTSYLDESPLKLQWRRLPRQFLEFLIRCLSIWEKGGIVLNPLLFTLSSPNSIKTEKIHTILNEYTKSAKHVKLHNNIKKHNSLVKNKPKPQVNNIRDVINNLNNEDTNENYLQLNLTEVENKNIIYLNSKNDTRDSEFINNNTTNKSTKKVIKNKYYDNEIDTSIDILTSEFDSAGPYTDVEINNHTTKNNVLPMFLNYLFRNEAMKSQPNFNGKSHNLQTNFSNSLELQQVEKDNSDNTYIRKTRPIIPNVKNQEAITESNKFLKNNDQNQKLTIDIKGNLIATNTSCHAFIGSMLSNLKNHSKEETLTDVIIAELSIFCKGALSTCKGIDVILL